MIITFDSRILLDRSNNIPESNVMIKQLIKSLSLSGTAQEITDHLNALTIEKRDDQLYTWAGVANLVGPVGAESLRLALEANNLAWVNLQLGGFGIQLSNPLVQQALLGFAQAGVPGCDVLAAQGIRHVSPYINAGGSGDVLLINVQTALSQIAIEDAKQSTRTAGSSTYNAWVSAVESWDGTGDPPTATLGAV